MGKFVSLHTVGILSRRTRTITRWQQNSWLEVSEHPDSHKPCSGLNGLCSQRSLSFIVLVFGFC